MSLYDVQVHRVTTGCEAARHWQGHGRTALEHAQAVWKYWMRTSAPNFCADAQRAVLWDEAGNRVVVEPFNAAAATAPGAH